MTGRKRETMAKKHAYKKKEGSVSKLPADEREAAQSRRRFN